jgi:hypothetical protein
MDRPRYVLLKLQEPIAISKLLEQLVRRDYDIADI